jgi:hypothetical protein
MSHGAREGPSVNRSPCSHTRKVRNNKVSLRLMHRYVKRPPWSVRPRCEGGEHPKRPHTCSDGRVGGELHGARLARASRGQASHGTLQGWIERHVSE